MTCSRAKCTFCYAHYRRTTGTIRFINRKGETAEKSLAGILVRCKKTYRTVTRNAGSLFDLTYLVCHFQSARLWYYCSQIIRQPTRVAKYQVKQTTDSCQIKCSGVYREELPTCLHLQGSGQELPRLEDKGTAVLRNVGNSSQRSSITSQQHWRQKHGVGECWTGRCERGVGDVGLGVAR